MRIGAGYIFGIRLIVSENVSILKCMIMDTGDFFIVIKIEDRTDDREICRCVPGYGPEWVHLRNVRLIDDSCLPQMKNLTPQKCGVKI